MLQTGKIAHGTSKYTSGNASFRPIGLASAGRVSERPIIQSPSAVPWDNHQCDNLRQKWGEAEQRAVPHIRRAAQPEMSWRCGGGTTLGRYLKGTGWICIVPAAPTLKPGAASQTKIWGDLCLRNLARPLDSQWVSRTVFRARGRQGNTAGAQIVADVNSAPWAVSKK